MKTNSSMDINTFKDSCSGRISRFPRKWITDITEFTLTARKVYLSVLVDCFDGLLPGWTIRTPSDFVLINTIFDHAIPHLLDDEHMFVWPEKGCYCQKSFGNISSWEYRLNLGLVA